MKNYDLYFPRYIPLELIHPIVKEYCDRRDMGTVLQDVHHREAGDVLHVGGKKNTGARYSAAEALAFEAGIFPRTVQDIYRGQMTLNTARDKKRPDKVKWQTVDKLLTAMDLVHLWYEKPLAEYYNPRPSPSVLRAKARLSLDVIESAA